MKVVKWVTVKRLFKYQDSYYYNLGKQQRDITKEVIPLIDYASKAHHNNPLYISTGKSKRYRNRAMSLRVNNTPQKLYDIITETYSYIYPFSKLYMSNPTYIKFNNHKKQQAKQVRYNLAINKLLLKRSLKSMKKRKSIEIVKSGTSYITSRVLSMLKYDVLSKAESMVLEYGKSALKNAVGVEHTFTNQEYGIKTIEVVTEEFIKKYDKNFSKHSTINYRNETRIINKQFIAAITPDTFMYVATGDKIGHVEERYFTYSKVSDTDMYLYIFGMNAVKYNRELVKLITAVNNNKSLGIFTVDSSGGYSDEQDRESLSVVYSPMVPRDLDTLFFSNREKEYVCDHIEKFNSNKDFYESRQILYKTGILLYGLPGTGKSSFVKAIASKYGRSIINMNTSNLRYIDLNALSQSINVDTDRQYIVLFEDIDTLFLNRQNKETTREDNAVINKLLQFLDSNTSPTNVIFIATTNHVDRLDDALLREGRFDLKVEVKPLARPEALQFGHTFNMTDDVIEDILDAMDGASKEYGVGSYNQSKLQARFLSKLENKSYEKSVKLHCEEINEEIPEPEEVNEEEVKENPDADTSSVQVNEVEPKRPYRKRRAKETPVTE